MGLFSRFSGPPDVEKLKRKKDVKGLLRALAYGEERKLREGERMADVDAEVIRVELGAIEAMAEIGATSAVPEVLRLLREPRGHWASSFVVRYESDPGNPYSLALSKFSEPAVPHLAGILRADGPTWLPCAAALALGHIGPAAASAAPKLIEVVANWQGQGVSLTEAATWALGRVEAVPAAVPALVDVLTRTSLGGCSNRVLQALVSGRFGQAATDALAKVLEGHEHEMMHSSASQLAALALCLLKDRRGMEAVLLPSNYGGLHGYFIGDKHTLAALGNFDDPRVRERLRRNLDLRAADMKMDGMAGLIAFDEAFHTALGLAQLGDEAGSRFLAEALSERNLAQFHSSLWETTYDILAKRALASNRDR